jgi:hypothetical protein
MELNPDIKERQDERPDVSAEERASIALLKWTRKLRWIGMEAEAEQMQIVLTEFTQRTGCWPVDGPLDCANGLGRRNSIRRIGANRRILWTTIGNRKGRLT